MEPAVSVPTAAKPRAAATLAAEPPEEEPQAPVRQVAMRLARQVVPPLPAGPR